MGGSFFGLVDDEWLELVHVLLFSEWERRSDGWHVAGEHPGYAANYELALHVALMLQDPSYPYADARAAERFRDEWLGKVIRSGPVALVAGIWDPFPTFPPDQVLVTVGRSTYAPSGEPGHRRLELPPVARGAVVGPAARRSAAEPRSAASARGSGR